ncbi:putative lipase essential for disintegration of autophagic bodies inside the vacuole [Serratia sp. FGI94]|uniref:Mbeg1-like protein n=1 Tax=Serratia sp. FGI94 TaxID=671990 RepID=UPI0002A7141D|nr:Mbeg1-like protein [Serratia sp. FGI94]AGB81010.1 putative lipase essential for disintegration of autophagic bodies inside the vacuole [Serratia sp. FGI94]
MRLIALSTEDLEPYQFSRIFHPGSARYALEAKYLFGASSLPSICRRYPVSRCEIFGVGVSQYREDRQIKNQVLAELDAGQLLAIDDDCFGWSPARHLFFIDQSGRLAQYPAILPPLYPTQRIIQRYEAMVARYRVRPPATVLPPSYRPQQKAPAVAAAATAVAVRRDPLAAMRAMSKRERWQARQNLIGRGRRSIYPDARIAAMRLGENNIAVEKAKLAQNVYGVDGRPINALETMPNVPEGWRDISNNKNALDRLGLKPGMLYDKEDMPDFFARVYAPDPTVFGNAMEPTVVFRGTRMEKMVDWKNNLGQGVSVHSDYYEKSVAIGNKLIDFPGQVAIAGHSLGGGLASAAAVASGKPAWTFNAAGLNAGTVEKYDGTAIGDGSKIAAYRVQGEVLTRLQEFHLLEDLKSVNYDIPLLMVKHQLSALLPSAAGNAKWLPGGEGGTIDKHGMQQVIDSLEQQKEADMTTITSRL